MPGAAAKVYNKYLTLSLSLQAILQSKVTVLMLTSLSVLSAAKQYLGDPIHCIFDTRWSSLISLTQCANFLTICKFSCIYTNNE